MRLVFRSVFPAVLIVVLATLAAGLGAPPPPGTVFRKVIDSNGTLPGQVEPIAGFYNPALSGNDVAFLSFERFFTRFSLHAELGGTLHRIATSGETQLPGGQGMVSASVTNMSHPMIRDGRVWWETGIWNAPAFSPGVIEYSQGALGLVMSDAAVDGLAGQDLSWSSGNEARLTRDGRVVRLFSGPGNRMWLIARDGGGLVHLNATGELSPDHVTFTYDWAVYEEGFALQNDNGAPRFRREHLGEVQGLDAGYTALFPPGAVHGVDAIHGDGRRVLVQAWHSVAGNFSSGFYGWSGGRWFRIARAGDPLPGGGVISGFSDALADYHSLDGETCLLLAGVDGKRSVILYRDGVLRRLISQGDDFDGGVLSDVLIDRHALDGNRFAFHAIFHGGRSGIYVGDFSALVPAPGDPLAMTFLPGGGARGTMVLQGRANCFYHLLRSDDLQRWLVAGSQAGSGAPLEFGFDEAADPAARRFYRVEETRYLPGP